MQHPRPHFATAVFDITYACNDTCAFCFNKNYLNKTPGLTLSEIKKNVTHVVKQFNVRQVLISGGEPTLHPEFFAIMRWLLRQTKVAVSLNTNALLYANPLFAEQCRMLFSTAKNPKRYLSLSLSTIDHTPPRTAKEKIKLAGTLAALATAYATATKAVIVITITKQNHTAIPRLITILLKQHATISKNQKTTPELSITVRGLFLDQYMDAQQKKLTVPGWRTIQMSVTQTLKLLAKNRTVRVRLFGLPLCYFKKMPGLSSLIGRFDPWWHEERMKVSHDHQFDTITPSKHHGDVWSKAICDDCSLNFACNKIQEEYLTEYHYPKLKPFQ